LEFACVLNHPAIAGSAPILCKLMTTSKAIGRAIERECLGTACANYLWDDNACCGAQPALAQWLQKHRRLLNSLHLVCNVQHDEALIQLAFLLSQHGHLVTSLCLERLPNPFSSADLVAEALQTAAQQGLFLTAAQAGTAPDGAASSLQLSRFTCMGMPMLPVLQQLPAHTMTELNLCQCYVEDSIEVEEAIMEHVQALTNLQELRLDYRDAPVQVLDGLSALQQLTKLHLGTMRTQVRSLQHCRAVRASQQCIPSTALVCHISLPA